MDVTTKKIILFFLIFFIFVLPPDLKNQQSYFNIDLVGVVSSIHDIDDLLYKRFVNIQRATIYHAVPWQTNDDNFTTASGFRLNEHFDHYQYRILAVSRDLLNSGFSYGDIVLVTGTGKYDGLWRIEDTMNRRYSRTIDFLVDLDTQYGLYSHVMVYNLNM